ncbi:unnamed protein product [Dibothriocephalus latus]|uniref:Uncharacterized protein n=1 Tax=Dibothriocephalus latus TaxID=60516 RepID=A0A3P7LC80_DIBLA|nr:unnamed protein product [Dibothriocephalus latus]
MQLVNSSTSTANSLSSSSISSAVTASFSLPHHSLETDSNASSSSNLFSPSDRAGLGGGQHATTNKRSVSVAGTAPIVSGLLLMGGKSKRSSKHSVGSCEGGLSSFSGSASPSQQNPNLPQIRLVVQYQSVDVLPLAYYDDLRKVGFVYSCLIAFLILLRC